MKKQEMRIRKALGLKDSTPVERSSRLQSALWFAKSHKGQKINIIKTCDSAWGSRACRANEGVLAAEIIGADGNPYGKGGYRYIWIYSYSRKRCVHCGKLTAWGHSNPMACVCARCAWEKKRGNE